MCQFCPWGVRLQHTPAWSPVLRGGQSGAARASPRSGARRCFVGGRGSRMLSARSEPPFQSRQDATFPMRVLIAEDDAVSRLIMQRAVERFGHECRAVGDGAQAWTLYQDGSFEVVLTDWVMPNVDGLELCRRIRQQPGPSYTYVILLSVLSDRG